MILFSETQINQVTNNTDINAGYAIEGSFSFSENGETVFGLLDQNSYEWSWRSRTIVLDCDRFEFSVF